MILVDSSVWIDYFRGAATPQSDRLDALLGSEPVATGDLILAEVLQGFADERAFLLARDALAALPIVESPLRATGFDEAVGLYRQEHVSAPNPQPSSIPKRPHDCSRRSLRCTRSRDSVVAA